jgi:hypothetical protein
MSKHLLQRRLLAVLLAVGLLALAPSAPPATAATANPASPASSESTVVRPRIVVVNKQSDEFDWTTLIGAVGALAGAGAGFAGSQSVARMQAKREDSQRISGDIKRLVASCGNVISALVPFNPRDEQQPTPSDGTHLIKEIAAAGSIQPWITDTELIDLSTKLLHAAAAVPAASKDERKKLRSEAAQAMNELSARARKRL